LVAIESVTKERFAKFGEVLEFPEDCKEQFYIVDRDDNNPWRLAVFRYTNKEISRMENHPTSKESFEPLSGITILIVAENDKPEQFKAFILNKPVCLKKGICHQVLSLTPEAQVKITENTEVNSEFYDFNEPIRVAVV
jgi:ureidoglycolate hydrolase